MTLKVFRQLQIEILYSCLTDEQDEFLMMDEGQVPDALVLQYLHRVDQLLDLGADLSKYI